MPDDLMPMSPAEREKRKRGIGARSGYWAHADAHRATMLEPMPAGVRVHLTGTKADRRTRHNLLLGAAHAAFDRLWLDVNGALCPPKSASTRRDGRAKKTRNRIVRRQRIHAYAWLADRLGIPTKTCHFGNLDDAQLERAIEVCRGATMAEIIAWGKPEKTRTGEGTCRATA